MEHIDQYYQMKLWMEFIIPSIIGLGAIFAFIVLYLTGKLD